MHLETLAALDRDLARLNEEKAQIESTINRLQKMRTQLSPSSSEAESIAPPPAGGTNFEKIRAFLRSVGNTPQLVDDIARGSGLERLAVNRVIYRTCPEKFMGTKGDPGTRKLWKIKDSTEGKEGHT